MAELLSTMAEATLGNGYTIRFEAIDPMTGDPVAGVVVSEAAVQADTRSGDPVVIGLEDLPPLFLPVPLDEGAP
jgi:hypothetical protein